MTEEAQYVEGFNEAFILLEYEPELFAELEKSLAPTNPFLEGMCDGSKQFKQEYMQRMKNDFSKLREKSMDRDYDFETE